jgi:hypothetical protein
MEVIILVILQQTQQALLAKICVYIIMLYACTCNIVNDTVVSSPRFARIRFAYTREYDRH